MQKKIESNIIKNQLFSKQDSLLLAISGGIDSVVLAHLLKYHRYNFSMAHCNFNLRGKDSESDEAFCKNLAKALNVKLYVNHFDVPAYSKKNKMSTQMAARELRYNWFDELLKKEKIDYLVTAHHANDVIETVLINLCRGTGIKGLKGIAEKTGYLVRPFLNFTKEEIETFAKKEKIKFRTDKSNFETKYERNFLRLEVIPALKKTHPNLEQTFLQTIDNLKEEAEIVSNFLSDKRRQLLSKKANEFLIDKRNLQKEKFIKSILHHLLEPFGFNASQVNDIKINLVKKGESGKLFYAGNYALTIDRDFIIIKNCGKPNEHFKTFDSLKALEKDKRITVKDVASFKLPEANELYVEKSKLIFPLTIRSKKTGDKFKPFGMKGFKLLSDFLKDEKLNRFEKENCSVLENGNGEIIWVIGYRSDERYKVENKNKPLLKLSKVE